MSRLAIVLPASGSQSQVDDTLVSILECRQPGWEILLTCDTAYDDPYDLADEVTFVRHELPRAFKKRPVLAWTRLANAALAQVQQPYLCVLHPGVILLQDSLAAAIEILERQPKVAAVSPLLTDSRQRQTVGVAFAGNGRRMLIPSSKSERKFGFGTGPSYQAGIFRSEALRDVGGWSEQIHGGLADIDLALRLASAGYRGEIAKHCRLAAAASPDLARGYGFARDAQRLYRSLSGREAISSLHPIAIIAEILPQLGLGAIQTLSGRLAGAFSQVGPLNLASAKREQPVIEYQRRAA